LRDVHGNRKPLPYRNEEKGDISVLVKLRVVRSEIGFYILDRR